MGRLLAFVYGVVCYIVLTFTALYGMGFVGNLYVPKSIDSGAPGPLGPAIAIDALLLLIFAVQHSVMARPGFKQLWMRIVPRPVERSTYNLLTSAALIILYWQWRPMTQTIWSVENPAGRAALIALFLAGWVLVEYGTFLINHLDFFGVRQVYLYLRGREYAPLEFRTPALYGIVRHPIMLGFIIAFWASPHMTAGHLFFTAASTAYIVIGIRFEERDLARAHGQEYEEYRKRVPMLLPLGKWK